MLYVGLIAAEAGLRRWQTVAYCSLQLGFAAYLRNRLHRAVTLASWVRLIRCRASDLTHAMTEQVERVGNTTYLVLRMARDAMLTFIYLAVTLYVSPLVTALVVSSGLVLMLLRYPFTELRFDRHLEPGYSRMAEMRAGRPPGDRFCWCADVQDGVRAPLYVDRFHWARGLRT